jgi:Xaa-Pro aminopeptidase
MRQAILDRQSSAMSQIGLDAVISCSPEGFGHVTGFVLPSQSLMRHRHAMAIVRADATLSLLGVDMEASTIRARAPSIPLSVWAEFREDPLAVLANHLRDLGLSHSKIGIEMDYLPAGDFARLQALLPMARFSAIEHVLARLRQIKTPAEIVLMRRLSRIADEAISDSLAAVRCGDTEFDIAAVLTRRIFELGAENFKMMIIATGDRSQLPNVRPTSRVLKRGDVCRVEIFAEIEGYQAGVCRTAYVQERPQMAENIWKLLVECKYRILEQAKPGASCRDIYEDFIKRLEKLDLPPIPFVGHGIGLHLHENPYIGEAPVLGRPGEDAQLEENMVLGFEPLCYRTGYGYGMQNKDIMLVTASGSELLSDHTKTDGLIRIA